MADGAQATRRRVRMATADDPVDAQAIANQAIGELRRGIEESPIAERLGRVVSEAGTPSLEPRSTADTPLVEPQRSESPADRLVLRPRPFGEASVRSAFGGIRGRMMQAKDDEPVIETDEGGASSPSDDAASIALTGHAPQRREVPVDESAELERAQTRDRSMSIAQGVLRGVQALGAIAGRATGIPGLAAIGGMSGVIGGTLPRGKAVERFGQQHALHREAAQDQARADQAAAEAEQQRLVNDRAERQLAVNISNAEAGQTNARASREMQNRLNETRLAEYEAENDWRHPDAENARGVFSAFLEAAAREKPELREDFADVVENLPRMSASQIRGAIDQLKIFRNAPAGARRRHGGGNGGVGRRPSTAEITPEQQAAYDQFVATAARQQGVSEAAIRAVNGDVLFALNPDEPRSLYNQTRNPSVQDVNAQQAAAARAALTSTPGTPEFENAIRQYGDDIRQPRGRYLNMGAITTEMSRLTPQQQIAALRSDDAAAAVGATAARAAIWSALNKYFHDNGGANIVDSEMRRYMSAFSAGSILSPPSEFLRAVQRDTDRARGDMDFEANRFPRAVVDEFRRRNARGRRR